jgi:hypothetical protein
VVAEAGEFVGDVGLRDPCTSWWPFPTWLFLRSLPAIGPKIEYQIADAGNFLHSNNE